MTSRKELSELTLRFQARTLNIYRKLFFDLQERDYSVELRDRAAKLAKALKITVISLTGMGGGKLKEVSDVCIAVAECETYKVQELHLPVYHWLCAKVEEHFFKN